MHVLSVADLSIEELIKIDARTSEQPCDSFGVNAHLGQEFADLYEEGELIFFSSKFQFSIL